MGKWNREPLRISDNRRYFMEGSAPFLWLGDTAWLLLQKPDEADAVRYLRNRKEKGYNIIQTVLVHTLPGISASGCSLAPGIKDVTESSYWESVDRILKHAEELGLYLGLLPAWGSLVKDGVLNGTNITEYAEFLGKRFKKRPNIVWILGGDVRGDAAPEVFRMKAEILKKHDPERLIGFHPFGRTSSSLWFHDADWLDFNMFQSGHRRYDQVCLGEWDDNAARETFYGEDSWKYVERDLGYDTAKPTLDGEPSYERIPQGLHDPRNPYWEDRDVRRYAYWSLFAGAAGHTYGSNAVMQFYNPKEGAGAYGVRESWQDALHLPGSSQMRYLKELMESVDFVNGRADDSLLLYGQKERYHRIAVFAGADYLLCYDYNGDEFMLDLSRYGNRPLNAYWMNPQDGTYSYIDTLQDVPKWKVRPVARSGDANDWVLVIRARTASC
ncbi:MAG: glycoside hydrolase family 140 protein [Butyrivibrio sp.]|nr:glycoside hydrolase family 140 protein [Acetatifactor muris]MCM1559926.1 glycoside hydrolase family 140 protein [Butyrivibrio sp.]